MGKSTASTGSNGGSLADGVSNLGGCVGDSLVFFSLLDEDDDDDDDEAFDDLLFSGTFAVSFVNLIISLAPPPLTAFFCLDDFDIFGIIMPRASAKLVPIELSISSTVDGVSVFGFFDFEALADWDLLGETGSSDSRFRLCDELAVSSDVSSFFRWW